MSLSYGETVLSRANARLEERRIQRQARQETLRRQIYEALPEVANIDRKLQQTIPQVVAAAFRQGEDPQQAVLRLRQENQTLQQRRVELLRQRGYHARDLEDNPFCPLCGDSGWRGTSMCSCLRTLCTEEQIRELSSILNLGAQSFAHFRLDYYGTDLWGTYGRSPRQNMEKMLAFCKNFAKNFGQTQVKNLFFYGSTGLGKTFLSACIAREVSEGGFSVVYDTAGIIFSRFEEQKFSRDMQDVREAKDVTRKYLRCDLLILDDLGSELTTPFVQSALYQLVNTRLIEGRSTIVSSNFTMDDLRQRYTPQIISRLEGEYETLPFFGKDIRLLKKT
jgi:DNA replication protein DnaC